MAVATNSVKPASHASVSGGSGPSLETTPMTPHSRPSRLIGTPTPERSPHSRAMSLSGPDSSP